MKKVLDDANVVDTVSENILNEMMEKELTFEQCNHVVFKVSSKLAKMKNEIKINQSQNHQESHR